MSSVLTQPSAVHIDLQVPDDCAIKHHLYSSEEICLTIGAVTLMISSRVLERILAEGSLAQEDLELIERYPDPLPAL